MFVEEKQDFTYELALQLSKDSYCTRLGNYKVRKKTLLNLTIQSVFIEQLRLSFSCLQQ